MYVDTVCIYVYVYIHISCYKFFQGNIARIHSFSVPLKPLLKFLYNPESVSFEDSRMSEAVTAARCASQLKYAVEENSCSIKKHKRGQRKRQNLKGEDCVKESF